jgi:alkylation response protein AidB-like acyl-CoA dehydrogenase
MAEKFISERNLKFMLYEVFDCESLTRFPYYQDHDREIFDLVIETALKMGRDLLLPVLGEMDKSPPEMVDGQVRVHPMVRTFMKECGKGGWIAAGAPFEQGGQQLPLIIAGAFRFILAAANYSGSVYPLLTTGAAHLIESFGSQELKDTYMPRMYSGEWQGTMALTEPQAGSSLADITTLAEPTDQGHYLIRGQKIFISAGDHDGVDNVIHLMLAKIKGAPAGVKGISLFVVPKERVEEGGALVPNDVSLASIYHKLGYRGSPITQLSMGENGDCRGYLVGEPNRGLAYMFQMMNEARIDVGLSAAAISSAAYYAALEYARERPQGRRLFDKDPSHPPVPIIQHPDVKRMLLFQRSVVEGSLSVIFQCCQYADRVRVCSEEEKMEAFLLLDLLTPVAKSYPSEMGILSVSQGLQCLGGYGYCDEFPLEQYYRDVRIHPIHEGTTGIQGQDLLGRKVMIQQGRAFELYFREVNKTFDEAQGIHFLEPYAGRLSKAMEDLKAVTAHLAGLAGEGKVELFLADATLYLEFFGIITVSWQWLLQALFAHNALEKDLTEKEEQFYRGKLYTFRYFFHYELPKIEGLKNRLLESDGLTVEAGEDCFVD